MDILGLIDAIHRADVRRGCWMPRVFDETFAQPGFMNYGHVQGTNCTEYRCMECGLYACVGDSYAPKPCTHVASDQEYDG